jgi:hypothetical protein
MPDTLVRVLMLALILELPGQREIMARFGPKLHSANFSSLSPALRQLNLLLLTQAMARELIRHCPPPTQFRLVALDAMPLTLDNRRGRACAPLNDKTRGGGVLWAFWLKAPPGCCPLQPLYRMQGAWSDTGLIRAARNQLLRNGPLYLLDRGFYAIKLIVAWLHDQVRFIVRARRNEVVLAPDTICGPPRQEGRLKILRDEIGILGSPKRRGARPRVRLVWAVLPDGQDLILLSDQLDWPAARLLAAYRQRERIEQFHRLIKQGVGLAHLYSFQPVGIQVQLCTVLLLVLLICLELGLDGQTTLAVLAEALRQLRVGAGLPPTRWRPNTPAGSRKPALRGKGGEAYVTANH